MASSRRLCIAADIKGWSTRPIPEQIVAQEILVRVIKTACREAELPDDIVQESGDGLLVLPPSEVDDSMVIPELVHALGIHLRQENRMLAEAAQVRLRLSMTSGLVTPGHAGFAGRAVVECFRLLNSDAARQALVDHPKARLAVIISDYLYQDVVSNGFRDLRREDFWQVNAAVPSTGFAATAWLWVSERTGHPAVPQVAAEAGQPPEASDELPPEIAEARIALASGQARAAGRAVDRVSDTDPAVRRAVLDTQADVKIALGEDEAAIELLEQLLRLRPLPNEPRALLRLGRCRLRLGKPTAAHQTFRLLVDQHQLYPAGYAELGRMELADGRFRTALNLWLEGVRLANRQGEPLDDLLDALASLPVTDR